MPKKGNSQVFDFPSMAVPPAWAIGSTPPTELIVVLRWHVNTLSTSLTAQRLQLQEMPATFPRQLVSLFRSRVLPVAAYLAETFASMPYPPRLTVWVDQGRTAADRVRADSEQIAQRLQQLTTLAFTSDEFHGCLHGILNGYGQLLRNLAAIHDLCDEYLTAEEAPQDGGTQSKDWQSGWQSGVHYAAQLLQQQLPLLDRGTTMWHRQMIEILEQLPETLHRLAAQHTARGRPNTTKLAPLFRLNSRREPLP